MSSSTLHLQAHPMVRRSVIIIVLTGLLMATVPWNPADAEPLPSKTDVIDGFTEDLDAPSEPVVTEPEILVLDDDDEADDEAEVTTFTAEGAAASEPAEAPMPFSMIGFEMPEGASVAFRTSSGGGEWTTWSVAEPQGDEDGPDAGTAEEREASTANLSDPFWVEEATHVQIQVTGASPGDVTAHIIDSAGLSASFSERFTAAMSRPLIDTKPSGAEAAARPSIISRSSWDPNNECRPRSGPSYAGSVNRVIIHHTAGSNTYSNGRSVVLGICRYHVNSNGWNDIGYNMVVDRFGNVYEGRRGGVERAVVGAHAAGHNTGTFGIAVMGNFESASVPQAAFNAVARTVAWKARLHGISINSNTLVGHRDVGQTACPGWQFQRRLPELRSQINGILSQQVSFSDVSGSHAPHIRNIAERGITAGCGGSRYCPDNVVTRAQMATFLLRAEGNNRPRWANGFSDVPTTHTHSPDINGIANSGWTQSCNSSSGGDRYCPERAVTRAEMATFIVRAHPNLSPNSSGNRFSDVPSSSSHRPAINAIADAGITVGCGNGNTFCPDRPVTRAEMATFLSRAIETGLGR